MLSEEGSQAGKIGRSRSGGLRRRLRWHAWKTRVSISLGRVGFKV
ncbi:unnamed protein product [Brassica rapa]|uniref:Uncharacterized protein n=2 Tax=Brassica TaxID=3705 RepID=A0A8D9D6Y6_BRACM|nr:unnamed protein product [Brassica napus]CAG7870112.1 unnamed protein product [Brassica rapa]CAG7871807.1 unnamed protein product [Brassica rapa]